MLLTKEEAAVLLEGLTQRAERLDSGSLEVEWTEAAILYTMARELEDAIATDENRPNVVWSARTSDAALIGLSLSELEPYTGKGKNVTCDGEPLFTRGEMEALRSMLQNAAHLLRVNSSDRSSSAQAVAWVVSSR